MIEAAMAAHQFMLSEFPWDERHRLSGIEDVLTPALVVYPEIVAANIAQTLRLLGGDPDRWRPHIKTAKFSLHASHAGRAARPELQVRHHP